MFMLGKSCMTLRFAWKAMYWEPCSAIISVSLHLPPRIGSHSLLCGKWQAKERYVCHNIHPHALCAVTYTSTDSTPCSYYVHCIQLPISTSIGKYFAFQVELTSEVQAVIRDCGIHNRCTGGYMHSLFCVFLLCMKYLCETVSSYIVQLKWILIAEACK